MINFHATEQKQWSASEFSNYHENAYFLQMMSSLSFVLNIWLFLKTEIRVSTLS